VVAIERLVRQATIADQRAAGNSVHSQLYRRSAFHEKAGEYQGFFSLFSFSFFCSSRELEITADYSYIHTNPQNNSIVPTSSLNGVALPVPFSSTSTSELKGNWRATAARSIEVREDFTRPE